MHSISPVIPNSRFAGLALWAMVLQIAGCGSYQLQGKVAQTQMDHPTVMVVSGDDARLDQTGLAQARVHATLDPDSMDPIEAGSTLTDGQGRFSLPIEHGAGFLLYDLYLTVTREGHKHAERIMPLPSNSKRLLILLPPGKDQWKQKPDVVEQTLEMGKPYMDDNQGR